MQLRVFRLRINKRCDPIVLELETTLSLTLISNPFGQVLDCETSPEQKLIVLMTVDNFPNLSLTTLVEIRVHLYQHKNASCEKIISYALFIN